MRKYYATIIIGPATAKRLRKAKEIVGNRTVEHEAAFKEVILKLSEYEDRMQGIRSVDYLDIIKPTTI